MKVSLSCPLLVSHFHKQRTPNVPFINFIHLLCLHLLNDRLIDLLYTTLFFHPPTGIVAHSPARQVPGRGGGVWSKEPEGGIEEHASHRRR